jgi:hypothetical protein
LLKEDECGEDKYENEDIFINVDQGIIQKVHLYVRYTYNDRWASCNLISEWWSYTFDLGCGQRNSLSPE